MEADFVQGKLRQTYI